MDTTRHGHGSCVVRRTDRRVRTPVAGAGRLRAVAGSGAARNPAHCRNAHDAAACGDKLPGAAASPAHTAPYTAAPVTQPIKRHLGRFVMGGAVSFPVWGTTARLEVTDPRRIDPALRALNAEIAAMGTACDRFHADSELSRLNAAGGRPVRVSALFAEALGRALDVAEATEGAVDPTVGGALVAVGYDRDIAEVRRGGPALRLTARPVAGWRAVELDGRVVRVPREVTLDLGATAKALTADRAAAGAALDAGCGVLVGLGGDIAVSGPPPDGGWRIRVAEDHRAGPGDPGQGVAITDGGLATSSVTVRRWRRGDRWLHHIIDPATGMPVVSYWRAVSVAAATCVDANAAATAALVKGPSAAAWLAELGLPARLVRLDGTPVAVAGWPVDESFGAAV